MESEIFKMRSVGLMGKKRLGPEYMLNVAKKAKRIEDALKTKPTGSKQLMLPVIEK